MKRSRLEQTANVSNRPVGIEEEFLLFRQDAAELLDAGAPVVAAAERAATDDDAQFEKELKAAQTELATRPGTDLGAVAEELAQRRSELVAAAGERGARVVASGTSPVGDRTRTTPNARYRAMALERGKDRFADAAAGAGDEDVEGLGHGARISAGAGKGKPKRQNLSVKPTRHAELDSASMNTDCENRPAGCSWILTFVRMT